MRHFKTLAMVATCLAATACAGPELRQSSLVAVSEPEDIIAATRNCADAGFTGGGMGYSRCIKIGAQEEAMARAGDGPVTYTAYLH